MRERIQNEGITNLKEHEVLEYLLYCSIPRKDTNDLAHRLIDEFGSFKRVLNAKPEHLQNVKGMTVNASLFLSVLPEIFRHYVHSATEAEAVRLANRGEAKTYLGGFFVGLDEERVYAVALDLNDRIIGQQRWTSGKRAKVELSPAQIVEFARKTKAVNIIIAHNHPGGNIQPSISDIELTENIRTVLKCMEFNLQDHLIFNDKNECFSFVDNNLFDNKKDKLL